MARGWAIEEGGKILVATVSPTRVAAIVNWLIVQRDVWALHGAADVVVERVFAEIAGAEGGIFAVEVEVTKVLHS